MAPELAHEFHRAAKGVPANLASIKRLLESGTTPQSLMDRLPVTLPSLFEFEWQQAVSPSDQLQLDTLTLLSHDRRKHTVSDAAETFGASPEAVRSSLSSLTFVKIPVEEDAGIEFVSESFRRFAAARLENRRDRVRSVQIDALLRRPESEDALAFLPAYLDEAGRLDDLLEFLSPDHFAAMIQSSQSLTPVQQKAELGLSTALRLDRDGDLFRFGLQRTVIADLDACEITRSEIEARMALGDYQSALALAQSSVLKQDRLRLLAVIARLRKQADLPPEPELLDQVSELFEELDHTALGDKLEELASDLMYSKPELAVRLVDRSDKPISGTSKVDWWLAQLAIVAAVSQGPATGGLSKTAEEIRRRIKDPAALGLSTAVSLLFGNYSPAEILTEVEKIEDAEQRIFLLRQWTQHTREPEKAGEIVAYALRLAIRTAEYTPLASDLNELARPLPFVDDEHQVRSLVGTLDTQKATIEKLGPTEDYVALQLCLTHAECRYDKELATRRLIETYYYISDISNLEIKTACTARLVGSLPEIDPDFLMTDTKEVLETSEFELQQELSALLQSTADHYLATRRAIEALAPNRFDLAAGIVKSLNIESRRDQALLDLYDHSVEQRTSRIPFKLLTKSLDDFADPDLRDQALSTVLERPASASPKTLGKVADEIVPLVRRIEKMVDPIRQCRACCRALVIMSKASTTSHESLITHILDTLGAGWERLENDSLKVDTGFTIAGEIAPYFREQAEQYLRKAETLRRTAALEFSATSYFGCIRVAIRAYSGLLPKAFDTSDDLSHLSLQIERVASDRMRIFAWTDLALKFVAAGRMSDARSIISGRIRPLLETIQARAPWEWQDAITVSAPALYHGHKSTALGLFDQLHPIKRDEAYGSVATFLLRGVWTYEPYENKRRDRFQLSYEDALDITELLHKIEQDVEIYSFLHSVVESALWRQNRSAFTQQQKADLAQRLMEVVEKKLPNPRFIKHDGFKVLAKAQIARLTRHRPGQVEETILEAGKVANIADRGFILAEVASSDSAIDLTRRVALLKDAKALADQIPSALDRAGRLEFIGQAASELDPSLCKQCIQEAFQMAAKDEQPDSSEIQREIVDLAHQIDPQWAASIAASLDDDEARKEARKRLALQELKQKMIDGAAPEFSSSTDTEAIAKAAWSALGQLNANRIEALPVSETRRFVKLASDLPLSKAYPILSWVIENAVSRRAHSDEARTLLRSLYDAALVGCELSFRLSARTSDRFRRLVTQNTTGRGQALVVGGGDRAQALEYLEAWLSENATGYLKVCDPYFGPDDLGLLQMVMRCPHPLRVSILTSRKHQDRQTAAAPIEEHYRDKWKEVSDQRPPITEIVVVGNAHGELPIHDRWWITKGKGLRLGTSFRSLGDRKESEISVLSETESGEREGEIDEFLAMRRREYRGEKLSMYLFEL